MKFYISEQQQNAINSIIKGYADAIMKLNEEEEDYKDLMKIRCYETPRNFSLSFKLGQSIYIKFGGITLGKFSLIRTAKYCEEFKIDEDDYYYNKLYEYLDQSIILDLTLPNWDIGGWSVVVRLKDNIDDYEFSKKIDLTNTDNW